MRVNLTGQFATSGATLVVGWMLLRLQEERSRRARLGEIRVELECADVSRRHPAGTRGWYKAEISSVTGGVAARGVVIPFPRRGDDT